MPKLKSLLFSISTGLLLWAGWPVSPLTFFIFIAFVPLLLLEHEIKKGSLFFLYTYLAMLIWNIGTTWWICNSTVPGGIAAIVANSFLMCIPWIAFYHIKKRLGSPLGYVAIIAFWLTFEYVHLNWELSWPWLTIGNVFASRPAWIQWYQYLGSSGGSLWVMAVNVLIALIILRFRSNGFNAQVKKLSVIAIALLVLPIVLSLLIRNNHSHLEEEQVRQQQNNVVVVQPNIDPYQKFEAGMQEGQLQTLIHLSESQIDSSTVLLIWPETALNLPSGLELDKLKENFYLNPLWMFLQKHPQVTLLTGIEGVRFFSEEDKTEFSRAIPESETYYDSYNAAAILDSAGARQFYYKSKLVPGVETLPSFLRIISKWFEQFGGTGGGYASQKERTNLNAAESGFVIAPAICYESIYGEFLTAYIRNGANVISIITNDGWWANTSGHKQHMQYARLRAIETRKWIARSANTGISCFISPTGDIISPRPWDVAAAIKTNLSPVSGLTFFAKYGDLISKLAIVVTSVLALWSVVKLLRKKLNKNPAHEEKHQL